MSALKQWRLEHGYTLDEAGALLGVSGPQMHRYENGRRAIPPTKVRAIAAITEIAEEILSPDVFGPPQPIQQRAKAATPAE